MRRAAKKASNGEQHHAPCILAGRGLLEGENRRIGLKSVLVEQDGKVRVASVRNELVGDVRNVATGFL